MNTHHNPIIFLDNDEQLKIQLINFILKSPTSETMFDIVILSKEFSVSEYTITQLIVRVNNDCKLLGIAPCFVTTTHYLHVKESLNHNLLNLFLNLYFKQSTAKLFFDLYLHYNEVNFSQFSSLSSLSRAHFFRQRKVFYEHLAFFLGRHPSESTIRRFFYNLYVFFNYFPDCLPESVRNTLQEFQTAISDQHIQNQPNVYRQITLIVYISYLRQDNHFNLTMSDIWIEPLHDVETSVTLTNLFNQVNFSENEQTFMVVRLFEESLLKFDLQPFLIKPKDRKTWQSIYKQTQTIFKHSFKLPKKNDQNTILDKLSTLIYSETQRFVFDDPFHFNIPEYYFKSIHPFLHKKVFQLTKAVIRMTTVSYASSSVLYSRIICSILAEKIPLDVSDQVTICVDFTNPDISTWISEHVTNLLSLDILTSSELDEKSDIYLSDTPLPNLEIPQVIWAKPPSPRDWFDLGELITAVKQNKS